MDGLIWGRRGGTGGGRECDGTEEAEQLHPAASLWSGFGAPRLRGKATAGGVLGWGRRVSGLALLPAPRGGQRAVGSGGPVPWWRCGRGGKAEGEGEAASGP